MNKHEPTEVSDLVGLLQFELEGMAEELAHRHHDRECAAALRVSIALTLLRDCIVFGWDRKPYADKAWATSDELSKLPESRVKDRVRAFVAAYFDTKEKT